jgi:multiple antibiotic resistance protein
MGLTSVEMYVQAAVAVLVIVNPVDPVKIVIFNEVVTRQQLDRRKAAAKVALLAAAILGVTAVAGREILELLGINLGAFGVVGGLIVAGMGFEMLYGGRSSRAQGTEEAEAMAPEDDGLVLPLTVPLMAGPGAITTVISVSTFSEDGSSIVAALVAVAIVAVLIFLGFAFLGGWFARMKPSAAAMVARIGGVLLATIGTQLVLGGIRTFYET